MAVERKRWRRGESGGSGATAERSSHSSAAERWERCDRQTDRECVCERVSGRAERHSRSPAAQPEHRGATNDAARRGRTDRTRSYRPRQNASGTDTGSGGGEVEIDCASRQQLRPWPIQVPYITQAAVAFSGPHFLRGVTCTPDNCKQNGAIKRSIV